MKTAKINIYQMFGTKSSICADISYRGKLLTYVEGLELDHIHATVKTWARNRGFSHVRISYDLSWLPNRQCLIQA